MNKKRSDKRPIPLKNFGQIAYEARCGDTQKAYWLVMKPAARKRWEDIAQSVIAAYQNPVLRHET